MSRLLNIVGSLLVIGAAVFQFTVIKMAEDTHIYLALSSIEEKLTDIWNHNTLGSQTAKAKYRNQAQRSFVNSRNHAESFKVEVDRLQNIYTAFSTLGALLILMAFLFEPRRAQNDHPINSSNRPHRKRHSDQC